jgi:hypothetical protein
MGSKAPKLHPSERRIHAALKRCEGEIVVTFADIRTLLDPKSRKDEQSLHRRLRQMAARHYWQLFVFDFGEKIRIRKDPRRQS